MSWQRRRTKVHRLLAFSSKRGEAGSKNLLAKLAWRHATLGGHRAQPVGQLIGNIKSHTHSTLPLGWCNREIDQAYHTTLIRALTRKAAHRYYRHDGRRAIARTELDARIARLYRLTRDEPRYILDLAAELLGA